MQKYRGQSYDNGSNIGGKYNGVQAKIMEMNELAVFTMSGTLFKSCRRSISIIMYRSNQSMWACPKTLLLLRWIHDTVGNNEKMYKSLLKRK